ncbi:uncharacterized protein [Diadema setosum]|uniref:uncharacterized protein n=1 Tax=Diadema setosum TaxID=31175 RepID=UPI003B3A89A1
MDTTPATLFVTGQGSNETYPGTRVFVFEDYPQRIIIAIIAGFVVLIGAPGNALVILAVVLSRRLRSPTYWFVLNLACADFVTTLCLPFNMVSLVSRDGWPLPHWVCAAVSGIILSCLGSSMMTLALIAYNRWYLLSQSTAKFQKLYTRRNIIIMIAISWMYPFLLSNIPSIAGIGRLGYSEKYKTCTQDTSNPRNAEINGLIAGLGVAAPLAVVIVAIYIRIFIFVTRHNKKMESVKKGAASIGAQRSGDDRQSHSNPISRATSTMTLDSMRYQGNELKDIQSPSITQDNRLPSIIVQPESDVLDTTTLEPNDSATRAGATAVADQGKEEKSSIDDKCALKDKPASFNETVVVPASSPTEKSLQEKTPQSTKRKLLALNKQDVKLTKKMALIVLAFFLCFLPITLATFINTSDPFIPWASVITTLNSCLNPLIYARTIPVFRRVVKSIILRRFTDIPEPIPCIQRMRAK